MKETGVGGGFVYGGMDWKNHQQSERIILLSMTIEMKMKEARVRGGGGVNEPIGINN